MTSDELEAWKGQNRLQAIEGAINYWTNKKTKNFYWWDKTEYTPEYCDTQIQYFKNMKL